MSHFHSKKYLKLNLEKQKSKTEQILASDTKMDFPPLSSFSGVCVICVSMVIDSLFVNVEYVCGVDACEWCKESTRMLTERHVDTFSLSKCCQLYLPIVNINLCASCKNTPLTPWSGRHGNPWHLPEVRPLLPAVAKVTANTVLLLFTDHHGPASQEQWWDMR